jgi:DNA-directed RNA polymerase specialized sigma24 family protein
MSSSGSVTHWLGQLKGGDPAAAQPLWQRYFRRLVGLARDRLRGAPRRAADEEDVALSAFDSFCRAAEQGRFPRLGGRDDLWQLLVLLTARKAIDLAQREGRHKRGGSRVLTEADLEKARGDEDEAGLARVVGREPTPEFAALVAEECRRLLEMLGDDGLRALAVARLEGYTTEELAARFEVAPRTVERRLRKIRAAWSGEVAP